jgi:hypothetical protein
VNGGKDLFFIAVQNKICWVDRGDFRQIDSGPIGPADRLNPAPRFLTVVFPSGSGPWNTGRPVLLRLAACDNATKAGFLRIANASTA